MAEENNINVGIHVQVWGAKESAAAAAQIESQLKRLGSLNANLATATGKTLPSIASQNAALKVLAQHGSDAAASLVKLRQEGSVFSQIFTGNAKANMAAMFKNQVAFRQTFSRLREELKHVQVISDKTTGSLRNLTAPERWRIMGNVAAYEAERIATKWTNLGKQAQWVGRQMIVGITLPIMAAAAAVTYAFVDLNRAQTQLQLYLTKSSDSVALVKSQMDELIPTLNKVALATASAADETTKVGAEWVAIGEDFQNIGPLTRLTQEFRLLSQGEIDAATGMELIRAIKLGFDITDLEQLRLTLAKVADVAAETSLTIQDIAEAFPIASASAKILNINAEELTAMMAGIRDRGESATVVATALKNSLAALGKPTTAATDAFRELTGLDLSNILFTPEGVSKGLQGLRDLAAILKDLTNLEGEQYIGILSELFGKRQYGRMDKLLASLVDVNSNMNQALKLTGDDTKVLDRWEARLKIATESAAAQWQKLKTQMQIAAASIGKEVFPVFVRLFELVNNVVKGFANLPQSAKAAIVAIAGFAAVLGPLRYMYGQLLLIWGAVQNIAKVAPMRALFGLKSAEDKFATFGAAASPEMRVISGMPAVNQRIAASQAEITMAINSTTAAYQAQIGQVNMLTAAVARLNAEQLLGVRGSSAKSMLAGMVAGPDMDKEIRKKLALAHSGGKYIGYSQAEWTKIVAGMSDDQAKALMSSAAVTPLTTAAASTGKKTAAAMVAGSAKGIDDQKPTFWAKIKELLIPRQLLVTSGSNPIALAFRSSLGKILGLGLAGAIVAMNWKPFYDGLEEPLERAGKNINKIINRVKKAFSGVIDGESGDGFKRLGEAIGRVIELLSSLAEKLSVVVVPVIKFVFDVIVDLVEAFTAIITLDFSRLFENVNGVYALFVRVYAVVGAAVAAFILLKKTILSLAIVGGVLKMFGTALLALRGGAAAAATAFTAARAAAGTAAGWSALAGGFANPWVAAGVVVTGVIVGVISIFDQMKQKAFEFSSEVKDSLGGLAESFVDLAGAVKGPWSEFKASVSSTLSLFRGLGEQLAGSVGNITLGEDLMAEARRADDAKGVIESIGDFFQGFAHLGEGGPIGWELNSNQIQAEKAITANSEARLKITEALLTFNKQLEGSSKKQFDLIIRQTQAEINRLNVLIAIREAMGLPVDDLKNTRYILREERNLLKEMAEDADDVAENIDKGKDSMNKFNAKIKEARKALKEWKDVIEQNIESQLSQLTDRIVDAMTSGFDEMVEDRLEAFDRMAEGQIAAIDKQIAAVEKQNEQEEWLQQQREWRQRREELLRQRDLNQMVSYRERLKAIHEGRFDDARLIELQAQEGATQINNELRALTQEQQKAVQDRKDEQLIDQLNKQKDALAEQLQSQREALADQLELQKEQLANQIEEIIEFGARSGEEWEDIYAKLVGLAGQFGIDQNEITARYMQQWGRTVQSGLADAFSDAHRLAAIQSPELAKKVTRLFNQAINIGLKNPALANYAKRLRALAAQLASGNLDPAALQSILNQIASMAGSGATGSVGGGGTSPSSGGGLPAPPIAKGPGLPGKQLPYHTGGYIHEGHGADEGLNIRAQKGEYVVKRDTVKELGVSFMDRLNTLGRDVLDTYHAGGLVNPTREALSAGQDSALGAGSQFFGAGSGVAKLLGKVAWGVLKQAGTALKELQASMGFLPGVGGFGGHRIDTQWGYITPAVLNFIQQASRLFPGSGFGTVRYSQIYGSGSISQHAYGNAADVFYQGSYPTSGKAKMFDWAIQNAGPLSTAHVIYNHESWSSSSPYKKPYGAPSWGPTLNHEDHVHFDANPQWTGNPFDANGQLRGGMPVGGFTEIPSSGGWGKTAADIARAKLLGQSMNAQRGWAGYWGSLLPLWEGESGWRWWADNPTSSAFGIPQALTQLHNLGGTPYMYDPAYQINWGLDYIGGRYGNPANAYKFWLANRYYHKGGEVGLHTGALVGKDRLDRFSRFEMPATLKPGETIIPENVTKALSVAAGSGGSVTIAVDLRDAFIADDAAFRKLHDTLEQTGREVARERGASRIQVKVNS